MITTHKPLPRRQRGVAAITLVELIVSLGLISALMLLMLQSVDQTSKLWQRSRTKVSQFQAARSAFDTLTRRLSQATLNTYYRAFDANAGSAATAKSANLSYRRISDLQFWSGPSYRMLASQPTLQLPDDVSGQSQIKKVYPGHAIFFFSQIGYTTYITENSPTSTSSGTQPDLRALDELLTGCGYFVQVADDSSIPPFVKAKLGINTQRRYRLMELLAPAEVIQPYYRPVDKLINSGYSVAPLVLDGTRDNYSNYKGSVDANKIPKGFDSFQRPLWMSDIFTIDATGGPAGSSRFLYARPLAENVICMLAIPKIPIKDRVYNGTSDPDRIELAPYLEYDSWRIIKGGEFLTRINVDPSANNAPNIEIENSARDNLLPPIIQIIVIAVDEQSSQRLAVGTSPDSYPDFGKGSKLYDPSNFEIDSEKILNQELTKLENTIRDWHLDPANKVKEALNYRVFSTDVVIRGSKWSRDPSNE